MITLECDLKLELERWDDPGDYPSGAGSGPLHSCTFVSGVAGTITVQLNAEDLKAVSDYADYYVTEMQMYQSYFDNNPGEPEHDVTGLAVSKWLVEKVSGSTVMLSVEEFEAEEPSDPREEYNPEDDYDDRP